MRTRTHAGCIPVSITPLLYPHYIFGKNQTLLLTSHHLPYTSLFYSSKGNSFCCHITAL